MSANPIEYFNQSTKNVSIICMNYLKMKKSTTNSLRKKKTNSMASLLSLQFQTSVVKNRTKSLQNRQKMIIVCNSKTNQEK